VTKRRHIKLHTYVFDRRTPSILYSMDLLGQEEDWSVVGERNEGKANSHNKRSDS
jgi:hypothetical protein